MSTLAQKGRKRNFTFAVGIPTFYLIHHLWLQNCLKKDIVLAESFDKLLLESFPNQRPLIRETMNNAIPCFYPHRLFVLIAVVDQSALQKGGLSDRGVSFFRHCQPQNHVESDLSSRWRLEVLHLFSNKGHNPYGACCAALWSICMAAL